MILNLNEYNPLFEIVKQLPENKLEVCTSHFDMIRKELFKAGITCETEDEFNTVLRLLIEIDII